ncbi:MAG: single-stranded-DNA-specific exonuclease RecJ [Parcubacteria group bacterium]|nr:single-stranded-DNA-specific exonuclease RecJ [Parcubacteria group bacterium]
MTYGAAVSRGEREEIVQTEISELLTLLLQNRGIEEHEREFFLNPDYDLHTHDPFLLKDMERSVSRVLKAVKGGERIVAYTDYDTDGIPAGIIFHDFFKKIGFSNFRNYIPHRHNEGFGVHVSAVEELAGEGTALIITADCGMADSKAIERANELGIDVIVTDHHLPQEMPPAYAIINPKQEGDQYPFKDLCGAAVAWKLVTAVLRRGNEEGVFVVHDGWEKWLLDMVGIATLSDMVPLRGENRALAYYGLAVLKRNRRKGLQELLRAARVRQSLLTEDDVGFVIGPRINVASRMDSPEKAFRLLATENDAEALALTKELEVLNNKRKGFVAAIVKEARARLQESQLKSVLVLGNTNWQPGLLGLAANTLMQEFSRPVFLWGEGGDGTLKGSCRSDGSVHLLELMQCADEILTAYGGHECAGGFSVRRDKLHLLADALAEASNTVPRRERKGAQEADTTLSLDNVTREAYGVIEKLSPYGMGNPKPLFLFRNAEVRRVEGFGKQKNHLKLIFANSFGREIEAIQFFAEHLLGRFAVGQYVQFSAHIEKNVFAGRDSLRLRIVDIGEE